MFYEETKIFTMATLFRFLAWILFRTKNKRIAVIVNSSTPPMMLVTIVSVSKLTSDFFVDRVRMNTGTELELFSIPASFTDRILIE